MRTWVRELRSFSYPDLPRDNSFVAFALASGSRCWTKTGRCCAKAPTLPGWLAGWLCYQANSLTRYHRFSRLRKVQRGGKVRTARAANLRAKRRYQRYIVTPVFSCIALSGNLTAYILTISIFLDSVTIVAVAIVTVTVAAAAAAGVASEINIVYLEVAGEGAVVRSYLWKSGKLLGTPLDCSHRSLHIT